MSRTYRLRRYKSKVAHRFTDGALTLVDTQRASYWYALIAHGFWGVECVHTDKPMLIYGGKPWDDVQVYNHTACMHRLNKIQFHGGSHMQVREITDSIATHKILPTAPSWSHSYIHPGRRRRGRHSDELYFESRAERRDFNMKMRKVFVTGDDSHV